MFRWFSDRGSLWFVRIGFMLAITAFNFWLAVVRWGWLDNDPRVRVSAVIVAGGTELALFAFLILFHQRLYTKPRRIGVLFGWGIAALLAVAISLYVNMGYFSKWSDADGNATLDLVIRGVVPMVFLIGFSVIPPKERRIRTQEEIDREYDSKIHEERRKQELALAQAHAVQDRREKQAKERAAHTAMLRLATQIGILGQYQVKNEDGDRETDWLTLEADLAGRGMWDSEQQRPILTRTVTPALEESDEPPNTITDAEFPTLPRTNAVAALPAGPAKSDQDKLQATIEVLTATPNITDDDLAEQLNLKKPASARYWRLKALEFLARQPDESQPVAATVASNGHAATAKGGQGASSHTPFGALSLVGGTAVTRGSQTRTTLAPGTTKGARWTEGEVFPRIAEFKAFYPNGTDRDLMIFLGMTAVTTARFWRWKWESAQQDAANM